MANQLLPHQLPSRNNNRNFHETDGVRFDFDNAMRRIQQDMNEFWQHTSRIDARPNAIAPAASTQPNNSNNAKLALHPTESYMVQDLGDDRHLRLRFDLRQFAPHEVQINIDKRCLRVHARHEEKNENRSVMTEYTQEFSLPHGVDSAAMRSQLSADGVLSVEAPLMALVRR